MNRNKNWLPKIALCSYSIDKMSLYVWFCIWYVTPRERRSRIEIGQAHGIQKDIVRLKITDGIRNQNFVIFNTNLEILCSYSSSTFNLWFYRNCIVAIMHHRIQRLTLNLTLAFDLNTTNRFVCYHTNIQISTLYELE